MRTLICIYCQLPFQAPAANCPHCGGVVDEKRPFSPPEAANEDRALELEDLDEEFELVPVGADIGTPFGPSKVESDRRPDPPLPTKNLARA